MVIHHIITRGTIDEQIMDALERKEKTQSALIDAVKETLIEALPRQGECKKSL